MHPLHQLTRPLTTRPSLLLRSIATTPALTAPPKTKPKSSDEPKIKQKKGGNKTKTKSTSASHSAAREAHKDKMERLMVMALDAPYVGPPPVSEEEMAARYQIGRNYVIGCWKRHNEINHDVAVKIRMKRYAIKHLPKEGQVGDCSLDVGEGSVYGRWREEAVKIKDFTILANGPPAHRPFPMYTPPIPGFDIEQYLDKDDEKT